MEEVDGVERVKGERGRLEERGVWWMDIDAL